MTEIWSAPDGRRWKIVTLPDRTGGETVLAVEVNEPPPPPPTPEPLKD